MFAILDLPGGAFLGTGVKTVVLFFEKEKETKKLWYYQLNVGRNMGKTNSLNENDLADFIKLAKTQKLSDNSWTINVDKINTETFDLGVQNPNTVEEIDERTPEQIISEIEKLDKKGSEALKKIKELL